MFKEAGDYIFSGNPSDTPDGIDFPVFAGIVTTTLSQDKQRMVFKGYLSSGEGFRYFYSTGSVSRENGSIVLKANLIRYIPGSIKRYPYFKPRISISTKPSLGRQGLIYTGNFTIHEQSKPFTSLINCNFTEPPRM